MRRAGSGGDGLRLLLDLTKILRLADVTDDIGTLHYLTLSLRIVGLMAKPSSAGEIATHTIYSAKHSANSVHHLGAAGGLALYVLSAMHTAPKKSCSR